jgi:pSer/pThr/pTyr-binding forkhead associated (FHA) protein
MKIRLRVAISAPNERVREFDLEFSGPEIWIGRDRESDIHIPLSEVSRKHARIVSDESAWFVEDVGSASGTLLNGQALSPHEKRRLNDAGVIQIQYASLTVYVSSEDKLESSIDEKTSVFAKKMVRDILDNAVKDAPYLLVMNGRREGFRAPIPGDIQEFVIGRAEGAHLFLDDANLSRRHACIRREWHDLLIEDVGSKNGVVVNGRKITALTRLKNGDEIFLGTIHLSFIDPTVSIIETLEEMSAPRAKPHEPAKIDPQDSTPSPESRFARRTSVFSGVGLTELFLGLFACGVIGGLVFALKDLLL